MLIVLDSGPLGLLSNPAATVLSQRARTWADTRVSAGDRMVVPEIADYEVRRELIRAKKEHGVERLDKLCTGLDYLPLSTAVMRDAARLWAAARNEGHPTASDAALDGDVLLAAQARRLQTVTVGQRVVVATTNPAHLSRYVEAENWTEM